MKKPSRNQSTRTSRKMVSTPSVKKKKKKKKLDRRPHEVYKPHPLQVATNRVRPPKAGDGLRNNETLKVVNVGF